MAVATINEVVSERFLIKSSLELLKSLIKMMNFGLREILYLPTACQIHAK